MARSDKFLQFPLCILAMTDNDITLNNYIAAYGIVTAGKSIMDEMSEKQAIREWCKKGKPEEFDGWEFSARLGAKACGVTIHNIKQVVEERHTVVRFLNDWQRKHGNDPIVRMSTNLCFGIINGNISQREFRVLCGIYSVIGTKKYISLGADMIRARAHGCKTPEILETDGVKKLLTPKQVRNTIQRLHELGFYARVTPDPHGRRTYYSHRLSDTDLREAIYKNRTYSAVFAQIQRDKNQALKQRIQQAKVSDAGRAVVTAQEMSPLPSDSTIASPVLSNTIDPSSSATVGLHLRMQPLHDSAPYSTEGASSGSTPTPPASDSDSLPLETASPASDTASAASHFFGQHEGTVKAQNGQHKGTVGAPLNKKPLNKNPSNKNSQREKKGAPAPPLSSPISCEEIEELNTPLEPTVPTNQSVVGRNITPEVESLSLETASAASHPQEPTATNEGVISQPEPLLHIPPPAAVESDSLANEDNRSIIDDDCRAAFEATPHPLSESAPPVPRGKLAEASEWSPNAAACASAHPSMPPAQEMPPLHKSASPASDLPLKSACAASHPATDHHIEHGYVIHGKFMPTAEANQYFMDHVNEITDPYAFKKAQRIDGVVQLL